MSGCCRPTRHCEATLLPLDWRALPGGRTTGPEDFVAATVRELAEETGLVAEPRAAHVVTMLVDDSRCSARLTAVVRSTAWTAVPIHPEPNLFPGGSPSTFRLLPALGTPSSRPPWRWLLCGLVSFPACRPSSRTRSPP
ncbi:NUDIX domain-containing protein [Streptomyces massasporeus]|uniref:NUDIX domain-containing protein n=1 Tax=Streptomyces massasporeus TaxID=67324 RepID=UPI0033DD4D6F